MSIWAYMRIFVALILATVALPTLATPATSYYIYDESGHVVGEYDANGNPIEEHVYLGDRPVAVVQGGASGTVDYVSTDQLNTPRVITDSSKTVMWSMSSDPFGNGTPAGSLADNQPYNLRFPGQYYDAETGHDYNYHRDYDSSIGRYVESDLIGLKGGINTYAYVGGNPLVHSDARGLDYWVEGAQPGEGGLGFHQKICVGKPGFGHRFCISFGDAQPGCYFHCHGQIYDNTLPPAPYPDTDMYRYTTSAVDDEIFTWFSALVGTSGTYSLIGNNCRNFSQNMFNTLNAAFSGSETPL